MLFVDIVGCSKLLINEQSESPEYLNRIVRGSEQVLAAEAERKLLRFAAGDGMALVFRGTPQALIRCAVELGRGIRQRAEVRAHDRHWQPLPPSA